MAGNVTSLQPGTLDNPGWAETTYRRLDEGEDRSHPDHYALVRVFQLPGGFRILVGRDLDERERLYHIVTAAGPLVGCHRHCAGTSRRFVRHPPRAARASMP